MIALFAGFRAFPPGQAYPLFDGFDLAMPAFTAALLLAGAAAGQVFRAAMTAIAPFLGLDLES